MTALSLVVAQTVAPVSAPVAPKAKRVSPAKLEAKAKAKQAKVVSELNTLRAELKALTGGVVSPLMTVEQIKAKIEELKNPTPEVVVEEKARVIPSKPQGIGAFCIAQLKAGTKPKDVLIQVKEKFPSAQTSMACVYWYASKIKAGIL
jgi:hypothetical protein